MGRGVDAEREPTHDRDARRSEPQRELVGDLEPLVGRPSSPDDRDPRLLVFEFAHDLLLRGAQVALLHRFVAARRENRSLCHQLIMGQGKTTVIAPLLAIMLADRTHLVISVVPMPLMPSARAA